LAETTIARFRYALPRQGYCSLLAGLPPAVTLQIIVDRLNLTVVPFRRSTERTIKFYERDAKLDPAKRPRFGDA
jgi:hypothetical protein